jgi:hypothetical protein
LFDLAGVVLEDLHDGDVGVAVVDGDVDAHLFEREDGGVRGLLVARDEGAGVGPCGGGGEQGGDEE